MVLFPIFEQQQLVLGVIEDATAQQRMERALAAKSSGGWMQDQEFVDSGAGISMCDEQEKYTLYVPVQPGQLPGFGGLGGSRRETVGHGLRTSLCVDPANKCIWRIVFYSRRTVGNGASITLISEDGLAQSMIGCSTQPLGGGNSTKRMVDHSKTSEMNVQLIKANSIWALPKPSADQLQEYPICDAGDGDYAKSMVESVTGALASVTVEDPMQESGSWYECGVGFSAAGSE